MQAALAAQYKLLGKRLPRKTAHAYKQLFAEAAKALGLPANLSPPGGADATLPNADDGTLEESKAGLDAHGRPVGKRPRG